MNEGPGDPGIGCLVLAVVLLVVAVVLAHVLSDGLVIDASLDCLR